MIWQLSINAVSAAGIYVLVAIGLGLVYRTAQFFHFAHAAACAFAPYLVLALHRWAGLPLWVAFPGAVVLTVALGWVMEMGAYKPLRRRGASSLAMLLASLGLYVLLQNVISVSFGDESESLRWWPVSAGWPIGEGMVGPIQLAAAVAGVSALCVMALVTKYSALGKAFRAVASDPELAGVSGVSVEVTITWGIVFATVLAAIAGLLSALEFDATPTMGMGLLMPAVVVAVVGGMTCLGGLALASLLLALAQQLAAYYLGGQWQPAIAFSLLLVVLLLRPRGLGLGSR